MLQLIKHCPNPSLFLAADDQHPMACERESCISVRACGREKTDALRMKNRRPVALMAVAVEESTNPTHWAMMIYQAKERSLLARSPALVLVLYTPQMRLLVLHWSHALVVLVVEASPTLPHALLRSVDAAPLTR